MRDIKKIHLFFLTPCFGCWTYGSPKHLGAEAFGASCLPIQPFLSPCPQTLFVLMSRNRTKPVSNSCSFQPEKAHSDYSHPASTSPCSDSLRSIAHPLLALHKDLHSPITPHCPTMPCSSSHFIRRTGGTCSFAFSTAAFRGCGLRHMVAVRLGAVLIPL